MQHLQQLAGTWQIVSAVVNGKDAIDFTRGLKLVIVGSTLTMTGGPTEERAHEFELDPTMSPKHLNVQENDRISKLIYALNGDTLTICSNNEQRPDDFAIQATGTTMIAVFKRQPTPKP